MMSACLAAGWSPAEYESASHPLQIAIRATIARLLGREPSTIPLAVDGCAVPTFSISMREIAYLYALLADADALAEPDANAARLVRNAMISHPHLVSYRGHLTDQLGGFLGQQIVSKGGAEGVFGFGLPEQKVGIAIKILDGHPRAIPAVAGQVLARYLPNVDWSAIESVINPPLINTHRDPVGRIVSVLGQS
jgi:L-asparaginase II